MTLCADLFKLSNDAPKEIEHDQDTQEQRRADSQGRSSGTGSRQPGRRRPPRSPDQAEGARQE
eukprot:CAMPEP_0175589920 /NCGR_PEP_ID=MMETSP0096-20121207/52068_1 /TAXON_ID=311494 /ORGANISM="Alexandrium monilatum, Strain CCMP3105" /LENGTH=62 /DNA_ID=CAMNT_0016893973 /DNA_START=260 /DNA_END=449 /DNA_ORIENTATION=-